MEFLWYFVGFVALFLEAAKGNSVGDTTASPETKPIPSSAAHEALLDDLWRQSSVARRNTPPFGDGSKVFVEYGMSLISVKFFDDKAETADLLVWEQMQWTDNRLMWDPSDYDDITAVRVPSSMIWKPDIMTYNSYVSDDHKFRGEVYAVVSNTGKVSYIPPATKQILCQATDDHSKASCSLKIGSWTYSGNLIDISFYNDVAALDVSNFSPNSYVKSIAENKAVKNSVKYDCCPEEYQDLKFTFDLELENSGSEAGDASNMDAAEETVP